LNPQAAAVLRIPQAPKGYPLVLFLVGAILAILYWTSADGDTATTAFAILFVLFALGWTLSVTIEVCPTAREARRVTRLFGVVPVYVNRLPLNAFIEIRVRNSIVSGIDGPSTSDCSIELVGAGRKRLQVALFSKSGAAPGWDEAESLIARLAEVTSFPVVREDGR
jgi:hypothetical protein